MSKDDSLCSPLLERLKRLQEKEQICRQISSDILDKVKSSKNVATEDKETHLKCQLTSKSDLKENLTSSRLQDVKNTYFGDFVTSSVDPQKNCDIFSSVVNVEPKFSANTETEPNDGERKSSNQLCSDPFMPLTGATNYKNVETEHLVEEASLRIASGGGSDIAEKPQAPFPFLKKDQGMTRFNSNTEHVIEEASLPIASGGGSDIAEKPQAPFPFLKKGKGMARFNSKPLKGFKKRQGTGKPQKPNANKCHQKFKMPSQTRNLKPADKAAKADVESNQISAFEKLEQLAERESFCSTSTSVVELLNDDVSASPVLKRDLRFPVPFARSFGNQRSNAVVEETVRSQNPLSIHNLNYGRAGILKTGFESSTSPKVKFLERGVQILEYNELERKPDFHSSICSDDSDLISVSDLENLARLNFNVNVVYEQSPCKTKPNSFSRLGYKRNEMLSCLDQGGNVLKHNLGNRIILKNESSHHKDVELEDVEIQSHKLLLLSKVNDLSDEIKIFKKKNNALEELVSELEMEKKNLLNKQDEIRKASRQAEGTKKIKPKTQLTKDPTDIIVSKKLQDLSQKILKFEIENKNLKRKLKTLQEKEEEARKDLNRPEKIVPIQNSNLEAAGGLRGKNLAIQRRVFNLKGRNTNKLQIMGQESKLKRDVTKQNNSKESDKRCPKTNVCRKTNEQIRNSKDFNEISQNIEFQDTHCQGGLNEPRETTSPNLIMEIETLPQIVKEIPTDCEPATLVCSYNPLQQTRTTSTEQPSICEVPNNEFGMKSWEKRPDHSANTVVQYSNGTKKIVCPDKVIFQFAEEDVIHTVFKEDGREETHFGSGQKEIYFKDGSYQVIFPDGSSKSVYKDGAEICVWKDGTVIRQNVDGTKSVHFPNGQKEIYEDGRVSRVYPDGTLKILHDDGTQETRYPNGRIRLKDKLGNVSNIK